MNENNYSVEWIVPKTVIIIMWIIIIKNYWIVSAYSVWRFFFVFKKYTCTLLAEDISE